MASSDSFQDIFTQAAVPGSAPLTFPVPSAAAGPIWTPPWAMNAGENSPFGSNAFNRSAEENRTISESRASPHNQDQTPSSPAQDAGKPNNESSSRISKSGIADKVAQHADSLHAEGAGNGSAAAFFSSPDAASGRAQAPAHALQADVAHSLAATSQVNDNALVSPGRGSDPMIDCPAGLEGLAGSAFAIHITAPQSQSSRPQGAATSSSATLIPAAQNFLNLPADGSSVTAEPTIAADVAALQSLGQAADGSTLINQTPMRPRQQNDASSGPGLQGAAGLPFAPPPVSLAPTDPAYSVSSTSAPARLQEITEESPETAQTIRTVRVQLAGDGEQRVDLHLVEHAGGLSINVRASDNSLTRGLQEHMPELSARLAAEHYHSQVWLPASSEPSVASASGRSPQQQNGQSSGQGDSRQQQSRQQDQNQPQAWWRQLAALGQASSSQTQPVESADTTAVTSSNINPATTRRETSWHQ